MVQILFSVNKYRFEFVGFLSVFNCDLFMHYVRNKDNNNKHLTGCI